MSNRLLETFEDLMGQMEEPPSWEEVTAHQARPSSSKPDRRWMALVAGVASVVVIGAMGLLLRGEGRLAAESVPYVRIDWTQEVEMRCEGMDIEDNGGFDAATIEIWGPTSNNLYRLDATAPDGTVERQILEMGADDRLSRAWYSRPLLGSEEETVFRVTACSENNSSYSMAQAPLFPITLLHREFIHLSLDSVTAESPSTLEEALADRFDDQQRDEWRGRAVIVFSEDSEGVDELGAFTRQEELWVDLTNRRAERHLIETDSEVLGRQSLTREVTDRTEMAPEDVSFNPTELHEIFDRSQIDEQQREAVTTTSITPLDQPLMDDAVEIAEEDIPTLRLREAISPEQGDQLYRVPVDGHAALVRLRGGSRPHIFATSCDVLAGVVLPDGWDGTCLERTVDGQRQTGTFPYGTSSDGPGD